MAEKKKEESISEEESNTKDTNTKDNDTNDKPKEDNDIKSEPTIDTKTENIDNNKKSEEETDIKTEDNDTKDKPKEDTDIKPEPTIDTKTTDTTKEQSTKEKKSSDKQNRQTIVIITLMISMIVIILLVPYIKHEYFDTFTYINLDFQKTQLGELVFYSTSVPVANINGQVIGEYTMSYNRRDPRKLEYIEVNTPGKKITFKRKNKTVFITLDPDMEACDDNVIALSNLAGFLSNFAKFDIQSGVSDKEYANSSELDYVTCNTHQNNAVISITSGNTTNIKKYRGNCFVLTYNNCEIIEVTEKFNWVILEDYISKFERIEPTI